MNWLDVLLAVLLLVAAFRGWARGVVAVVLGIGGLVAALLLSRALAEPLMHSLNERFGWLDATRNSLVKGAVPALGGQLSGLTELPVASRWLAETYDRLALAVWTFILALVLFGVFSVAIHVIAKLVTRGLDLTPLALPNRLLGAVLNFGLNGFMLGSICAILLSLPGLKWLVLANSRLAPPLATAVQSALRFVLASAP